MTVSQNSEQLTGYDALIRALQILVGYAAPDLKARPIDVRSQRVWLMGVDPDYVDDEDAAELRRLGVAADHLEGGFFYPI